MAWNINNAPPSKVPHRMSEPVKKDAYRISTAHWKSLQFFNIYRFCIATILLVSLFFYAAPLSPQAPSWASFHLVAAGLYLAETILGLLVLHYYRQRFNLQLSVHVLIDVMVMILLMSANLGFRGGPYTLLLVTLAGASLLGRGRLVLFYAAVATITLLLEQSYRSMFLDFEIVDFVQVGLFCMSFFAIAIAVRLLASRVMANEKLALERGIDLANQTLISQGAIEGMQDGILVIDRESWIKQYNPRAKECLGLSGEKCPLSDCSTELARKFQMWCVEPSGKPILFTASASDMLLRARFVATESTERDVLVFLEDMGRIQEQARQLKLAALGRLTASIAHEIRNPLSAINHASELLLEENNDPMNARLLRIVLDNTQRVERIVSDVLALGRRDQIRREILDLRQLLPDFVAEFVEQKAISAEVIRVEIDGLAQLCFDRAHFYQVLWNLVGNASRYAKGLPGSIRLQVSDGFPPGRVGLHIINDGESISEEQREQMFEPFFTTHSHGTGLGLYISRELCDANAARLELLEPPNGVDFYILGESVSGH